MQVDNIWFELVEYRDFLLELNKRTAILQREISFSELYDFVDAKEDNIEMLRQAISYLKEVHEQIQYQASKSISFEAEMEQVALLVRYYRRLVSLIESRG